ncbi:C-_U-editing enzyme APOBEC-1-like [Suncus etruscus]|uniref:C->U-editing enzyme APOBEC-1-like n=1 Tax=Suncus etruscus TaxID=109475 RepID=UPI002110C262|nr:C->U-editing enzyme APOBEC-1-like [Suncus etruscus]
MIANKCPWVWFFYFRRKIEPWEFENFFDPRQIPTETCLLYEIKWNSGRIWKHTARNTKQHVEINFLEKLKKERRLFPWTSCSITWYLSWSPCWECAKVIEEFLTQHPRITLIIYVARLYLHMKKWNRRGLQDLFHRGVIIKVMSQPEYKYCWRYFVDNLPEEEYRYPRYPPLSMALYALELLFIIAVSDLPRSLLLRKIEPFEFINFFDPGQLRKETCLLYEIKWNSGKIWKHTARNTSQHAEINFLENLTTERHLPPSLHCSITWFLSWSPCWECAKAIREFLTQFPRVTLIIFVARLYWHTNERNRQGLRDLINRGVIIKVMSQPEYEYCWRNFVSYPLGGEHHCPRYPSLLMELYALELHCVILGLPFCFKIPSGRQNQLNISSFVPQMCHFQRIPPIILFKIGFQ